jgi:hypothetical protein
LPRADFLISKHIMPEPEIHISDRCNDNRHPKLVFQERRGLIACKWDCPLGRTRPDNLCVITANEKHLGSAASAPNQDGNQAGWLSFTIEGVKYMGKVGVQFPPQSGLFKCPPNSSRQGNRELGNTVGPGITYDFGFYFGTRERALEWLVALFHLRGKTVCKCAGSDNWPTNLNEILTARGVGECP